MKKVRRDLQTQTAVIYCRVSTKGQSSADPERDPSSLDTQAEACIAYAGSLGYTVGRVTQEVFSGAELWDRPLLARDRADIREGKFQALIAYSTDRLSRDPIHLAIIAEECARADVAGPLFVTEPLDTSPEAALIRYVKGYAAQIEREKIKERTLRGRRAKLAAGKPTFHGWDLYGYRPDRANARYEVYEPEAAIVRRIFDLYLSGDGLHAIASRFNLEGIPSPKAWLLTKPVHWSGATVYRILTSASYKGEEVQWRTTRNRRRRRDEPRPESEQVRLPDGVRPAIISADTWSSAQERLRANQGEAKRNSSVPLLLRGLIFCSECGWRMIRNHFHREKYDYDKYRCGSRWRPFKTACKGKAVPVRECEDWIWGRVREILLDPNIIERELARVESEPEADYSAELCSITEQAARAERSIAGLVRQLSESLSAGEASAPYIRAEIERAAKQKEALDARATELRCRIEAQQSSLVDMRSFRDYCKQVGRELDTFGFEEKRLAFEALALKVTANGDSPDGWDFQINVPVLKAERDVNELRFPSNAKQNYKPYRFRRAA